MVVLPYDFGKQQSSEDKGMEMFEKCYALLIPTQVCVKEAIRTSLADQKDKIRSWWYEHSELDGNCLIIFMKWLKYERQKDETRTKQFE